MKNLLLITLLSLLLTIQFLPAQVTGWYWQIPSPQGNTLCDFHMLDPNTALAVGACGTIIKTYDGGNNWEQLHYSFMKNEIRSVCFTDANIGWAVGFNGTIIKTIDGGHSWIAQNSGTQLKLYSVFFTDVNLGWAVGESGIILKTDDSGQN